MYSTTFDMKGVVQQTPQPQTPLNPPTTSHFTLALMRIYAIELL